MKRAMLSMVTVCFALMLSAPAFGKGAPSPEGQRSAGDVKPYSNKHIKGANIKPGPFRVISVSFKEITVQNAKRLVAAVVFNRNVDAATVLPNNNIRLLKKNQNHQWVDAATQNNTVNVRPNFVTWVSGAALEPGVYIMHLRGTIKSRDGIYLDCNGDGKGEGGALPAYQSQMYQVTADRLIPIDEERMDELRDRMNQ